MSVEAMRQIAEDGGQMRSVNPMCTGTSVFAVRFDGGVAIAADTNVSYGKTSRFRNFSRIFTVSKNVAIAFSGDHADFQFLKSIVDDKINTYKTEMNDFEAELSANALFNWLTAVMYHRRCKFDPIYNTIIVAGAFTSHTNPTPFLSVVNLRGIAYDSKYLATGIGGMLIRQTMENEFRNANGGGANKEEVKLTRDQAMKLMRTCIEVTQYRDALASPKFELVIVSSGSGVERVPVAGSAVGKWKEMAEFTVGYS